MLDTLMNDRSFNTDGQWTKRTWSRTMKVLKKVWLGVVKSSIVSPAYLIRLLSAGHKDGGVDRCQLNASVPYSR